MTTTGGVTPIKVSGPAGLLAAVPPMLGFHPTNSLVLMCLSGDRRRVGPVARVDLPTGHDRAMARHLTIHALNHADEVAVISYQDDRRRPALLDDLLAELDRAGVKVMDAIVVRGGRARPARSATVERAHAGVPVPGADDPQVAALIAAGALAGRSVLASREQLRQSIAGPTGKRLIAAERAVDDVLAGRIRATERTTAQRASQHSESDPSRRQSTGAAQGATGSAVGGPAVQSPGDEGPAPTHPPHAVPDELADLIDRAFAQVACHGTVDVQVSIELAMELSDDLIRDAVLARAITELDSPWLPTLIACATWTPDLLAPELCSVLSMVAYRHGDGALAQLAVDRCLVAQPEHKLAHLMLTIMSAGIRPEELEGIALRHEVRPRRPLRPADYLVEDHLRDWLNDYLTDYQEKDEGRFREMAQYEQELWWEC